MGPKECIKELGKYGKVMADPKLCDIPITRADDPLNAVQMINQEIEKSFGG
jgi:orotidine-5'-phosphate decarboxylase